MLSCVFQAKEGGGGSRPSQQIIDIEISKRGGQSLVPFPSPPRFTLVSATEISFAFPIRVIILEFQDNKKFYRTPSWFKKI